MFWERNIVDAIFILCNFVKQSIKCFYGQNYQWASNGLRLTSSRPSTDGTNDNTVQKRKYAS